jgi:RNA polymerase sigma factor (sigma-70 family)
MISSPAKNRRLDQISTKWSLMSRAHTDHSIHAKGDAQQELLERYQGAIRRYLLGALHDANAADEVFQEFALRFLRGGFRAADPQRGRFRNLLRTALMNMVFTYRKRHRVRTLELTFDPLDDAEPMASGSADEEEFLAQWRKELLDQAWQALDGCRPAGGVRYYMVLRWRCEHPGLTSEQMAERLTEELSRSISAVAVRKHLQRARERFTDFLVEAVARPLGRPTREELAEELIDLGFYAYCRDALGRWRN